MLARWSSHAIGDHSGGETHMPLLVQRENIHALIIEPFLTSSNSRGALVVFDTVARQWTQDEAQLVRLLAGQAAMALEKIRLLTDARQRAKEFSGLYQVAGEIMSRRDLSSVLKMIVHKAAGFYQVSNAFIYFYDEGRQEVVLSVVFKSDLMLGTALKMGEGLAGRVAASLKPMIVENYSEWDKRARVYDNRTVLAVLEVPMLFGGNLIGILGIESVDPSRKFDENDLRSLSLLAEQAASAINNARLFSQIEDRNRELDRLSRASSTLLAGVSSDIPALCRSIADLLASEFHNSHCSIWLTQEDGLTLDRVGVAGPFVQMIKPGLLTTKGPGVIAKAIRMQDSINTGNVLAYPEYVAGWEKTRSELVVPLRSRERMLGAIDLQNQMANAYSADDVRLIEMIASRAALMLEHVRLYQQTDHRLRQLTVLSNIDAAIASSLDLQVTLNILVSQISMHLNADAVDVMLLNPHLQMLEYAAGRGFRGNTIRRVPLLLGEDQAGIAALERTVVSVFDLSSPQAGLRRPERIAGEDFISMYAVPLVAKGQVKGVLELFYRHTVEPDPDWINFLEILARQAAVAVEDASLFNDMQHSLTELAVAYDAAIEGWARVLQMRHHEPDELYQNLTSLTLEMARRLGIAEAEMAHIYRGVLLHNIGKLDISDKILFKSGPLTKEEWDVVRYHPAYAYDFLQSIAYLRPAMSIPYCQHEKWDGSGYPRGLQGKDIPLEARIFSVVNVWTVLQNERPFRAAWDRTRATAYIQEQSGKEFDPEVVDTFLHLIAERA
jgi:GAF domain-containing protein